MNYYEHHIGDWAEATSHLSALEDGIYSRLIRKYYASEKSLPLEVDTLARWVNLKSRHERAALVRVLEEFFTHESDGWHNVRCDEEIERYHAFVAKQSNAGKASAAQRRLNGGSTSVQPVMNGGSTKGQPVPPSLVEPPTSHSPPPTSHYPKSTDLPRASFQVAQGAYPPTAGRADWITAERNFYQRIKDGVDPERLIEGVKRYAAYCNGGGVTSSKFVLSPNRFFGDVDEPWAQAWTLPVKLEPPRPRAKTVAELEAEEAQRNGIG